MCNLPTIETNDINFLRYSKSCLCHLLPVADVDYTIFLSKMDGVLKRMFRYLQNKELEEQFKNELEISIGQIPSEMINFYKIFQKEPQANTAKSLIQSGIEKTKDVYGLVTSVPKEVFRYFEDLILKLDSLMTEEQIDEYLPNPSSDVQSTTDSTEEVRESIQSKLGSLQSDNDITRDDTSPADSLDTDLSAPGVNFVEAGTIPDLMTKDVGTMTENKDGTFLRDSMKTDLFEPNDNDPLEDQNETDEHLAAINKTLFPQTQLSELCSRDGRKAKTVSHTCDVIVMHLKETFDTILCSNNEVLHIYPAFKVEKEDEIIFVVTLSETTDISVICNAVAYSLEIRVLHKFSNEMKTLMDTVQKEGHGISDECQRPISVTIEKWAKPLLETHKYLSVITASPLKSKRNKDSEILQSFVREPECCIVFCVHAKDFIYI